jgi:hypothetical protein
MTGPLTLAVAGLSFLVAACGGGASPSSVARIGKTTSTIAAPPAGTTPTNPATLAKQYERALKYSQCMRAHGIADFPDPSAGGGIQLSGGGPNTDLNPSNPTFVAAQNASQKYSPFRQPTAQLQAQAQARALAIAACMRKNGVPDFPDPQFLSGGRAVEKITAGVDPNSPTFQAARQKCSDKGGGAEIAPAP